MKIVAVLDIALGAGGGYEQALNAIIQMKNICKDEFEFEVVTTHRQNIAVLQIYGIKAWPFKYSFFDKVIAKFSNHWFWSLIQTRLKITGPLETFLIQKRCDLVYFTTPGSMSASLQRLNFISTLWDLTHRTSLEFPEVREFGIFQNRENHFKNNLVSAYLVLTDSERLADLASFFYGIERRRFLAMPFSPSLSIISNQDGLTKQQVLNEYGLNEGYFFYPAQFWPHKNHIRILEAMVLLKSRSIFPQVVFSGKDYGGKERLVKFIHENELTNQVHFLGFVPPQSMRGLYEGSLAVVMPTYFGPSNLPPLEAWALNKLLIYSDGIGDQVCDGGILVDPSSACQLGEAMLIALKRDQIDEIICRGEKRLLEIKASITESEKILLAKLKEFQRLLDCWK
jgi:glycosyltransferase involved in cell wall biosynthesis